MTNNRVSWLISDNTITVNYDGQIHMLQRSDAYAPKLIQALKDKNFDEVPNLVSAAKRIETFSKGTFQVRDGEILVDGVAAPTVLGRKIKDFADAGLPYEPLVKFAQNLRKNPSDRAINHLYQFLEKNDHPITDNGNFIAYKKVREDFKDVHSGTFDNSVGKVVEMARSMVNEDPEQTCSYGLHVANFSYARDFYSGGKMLEVEVNPADVVAIPVDYNQSKMRVCKYKVLGVIHEELSSPLRVTNIAEDQAVDCCDDDCFDCCDDCGCEARTCDCDSTY